MVWRLLSMHRVLGSSTSSIKNKNWQSKGLERRLSGSKSVFCCMQVQVPAMLDDSQSHKLQLLGIHILRHRHMCSSYACMYIHVHKYPPPHTYTHHTYTIKKINLYKRKNLARPNCEVHRFLSQHRMDPYCCLIP